MQLGKAKFTPAVDVNPIRLVEKITAADKINLYASNTNICSSRCSRYERFVENLIGNHAPPFRCFRRCNFFVDLEASKGKLNHFGDFMPHYLIKMFHCLLNTSKLSGLVSVDR
jgi:hypothetical protein